MKWIQINFSVIDGKNLKCSDIKSEVLKTLLKKHNRYCEGGKVIQENFKTLVKVFKLIQKATNKQLTRNKVKQGTADKNLQEETNK